MLIVCVCVCVCVCVFVCMYVHPSTVKVSSVWISWITREQINDVVLKKQYTRCCVTETIHILTVFLNSKFSSPINTFVVAYQFCYQVRFLDQSTMYCSQIIMQLYLLLDSQYQQDLFFH